MLPAWLGIEVDADPWQAAGQCVKRFDRAELTAMAEELPLAFAVLPEPAETAPSVAATAAYTQRSATPPRVGPIRSPLAIDLSALWAGPLCGQLLCQAGMRVIKVESAARPEPARQASPIFFDVLNAGKESLVLDFGTAAHRALLRALIEAADIVISSARPRALEQLELDPAQWVRDRPALIWIAITAHGWQGTDRQRVGFGDDAAVAAGLVASGRRWSTGVHGGCNRRPADWNGRRRRCAARPRARGRRHLRHQLARTARSASPTRIA